MAFVIIRNLLNASKLSANSKVLLNPVSKGLIGYDVKNTRTLTRSLFYLCRSRDSDSLSGITTKALRSNKCSCGCSLHTKGDKELSAFLVEEIENEKKATPYRELPVLEEFEPEFYGAEVILRKQTENETIIIKANVNNSVDAEDGVMDPNEAKDSEPAEMMSSKPEFTIEIQKKNTKNKISFVCSYVQDMPDEIPNENYSDVFQIAEISLHEGEFKDSTYCVSGDIMDGYLYDLLMNYLEERGISNDFAEKMITFFTAYEHKLYINLLKGMKTFVDK